MFTCLRSRWSNFFKTTNYRFRMRGVCMYSSVNEKRQLSPTFYLWYSHTVVIRYLFPLVHCKSLANTSRNYAHFHHNQEVHSTFYNCLHNTWEMFLTVIRSLQLICIFTPLIVLYPISFVGLKSVWYKLLIGAMEISGPVIIKLGQWASTRQDLFTTEFCSTLRKLQRDTKPHSWSFTEKSLWEAYGPRWREIFYHIENYEKPIGSGCVAQVYKAWIWKTAMSSNYLTKTKFPKRIDTTSDQPSFIPEDVIPVAVKVRHPCIEQRLRQDTRILKFLATCITFIVPSLKWLSLPECVDDFTRAMEGQVNFHIEAHNLDTFSRNFRKLRNVQFPIPLRPLTRPNVLVESFKSGEHVNDFVNTEQCDDESRRHLALLGVNTILKMVFHDNFIHGDLHPGNMLVEMNTYTEKDTPPNFFFHHPWRKPVNPLTLVILDCGIVSSLDEKGKEVLREEFRAIVRGDGEMVAQIFLDNSNHQCTNIAGFKRDMKRIVDKALDKNVSLQQVDVSELMSSVFSTMVRYKVKVDSKFSSVILSIMVLEGFGRSLDPTLDVLEKAKPFLFTRPIRAILSFL